MGCIDLFLQSLTYTSTTFSQILYKAKMQLIDILKPRPIWQCDLILQSAIIEKTSLQTHKKKKNWGKISFTVCRQKLKKKKKGFLHVFASVYEQKHCIKIQTSASILIFYPILKQWHLLTPPGKQFFWKHWEKETLLVTNNFPFSHSVFYPFG